MATNRDWVTAQGEKKEEAQYHRIVAWSKLAELCKQLLTKGSKVFVEGRLVYRTFDGKDGTQKSITEIVMDNMIVLGGGVRSASASSTPVAGAVSSTPPVPAHHEEAHSEMPNEDVNDKDIPF